MFVHLQIIIKDTSVVLTPPHIKAYMIQTLQGLEYLHAHWILHRVSSSHPPSQHPTSGVQWHSVIIIS